MAKSRIRKIKNKNKKTPPKPQVNKGTYRNQPETNFEIARKIFRFLGEDPELFDALPKHQKMLLAFNVGYTPRVRTERSYIVPRHYLAAIRSSIYSFIKTEYFSDEATGLTYLELFTFGLPFTTTLSVQAKEGLFNEDVSPVLESMHSRLLDAIPKSMMRLHSYLITLCLSYSQIHFRSYGFTISTEPIGYGIVRFVITLLAHESESTTFTYHNVKRKAFKVIIGSYAGMPETGATIAENQIYPQKQSDKKLDIYLQSHAIHRYKERVDIFDSTTRNNLIFGAMIHSQEVAQGIHHPLLAGKLNGVPFGYFTFITEGDKLCVTTFLPLVSMITPEGKKLYNQLRLSKDELIFLGMDKLSFYVSVDFDRIPMLREALITSGIWKTKMALDDYGVSKGEKWAIDEKKTLFVKDFFRKLAESHTHMADNTAILDALTKQEEEYWLL